jgi:hypothetical protein
VFTRTAQLQHIAVIAAAIAIAAALASLAVPFAHDGLPSGHDATAHITYTYLFDRALSQGQLPVRWVEWVRSGDSQPLFNFYPPGLYYLIDTVHALGLRLSIALKATVLLLWWCGALFTYAWLSRLGRLPAGLAAVLFALAPYTILDAFVRAAYPELAAIACAPALLWSIDRVIRSERVVDALLVAAFACLMLLCHLLSSLIFAPIMTAYALHRLAVAPTRRRVALLALGSVLGLGMAAFFILPSMLELHLVSIGRMTSGDADYQRHFVAASQWLSSAWGYGASVPGLGDGLSFRIDVTQWLAIVLAASILISGRLSGRRHPHAGALAFWLAIVLAAMFVMTEWSAPLWRSIAALRYLQFPWRYFMVISVGTAALAALVLSSVKSRTTQALIVMVIVVAQYWQHHDHLKPLQYFPRQALNIDNPRWAEIEAAGIGMRAFIERGFTPVDARQLAPQGIGRWTITQGEADVRAIRETDDRLQLEINASSGAQVRINTHYFAGWVASIDGAPIEIGVDRRYGFMNIEVPAGTHHLDTAFTNTPVRSTANAISAASIGLWLGGLAWAGLTSIGAAWRGRSATPAAMESTLPRHQRGRRSTSG